MILGIGIDMVDIREMVHLLALDSFLLRTFTPAERCAAPTEELRRAEYFAARFAAKEAVFKAIACLIPDRSFDLRTVETLHRKDGSPYVNPDQALRSNLDAAGITLLHLSITTEGDYAAAFVIAEGNAHL